MTKKTKRSSRKRMLDRKGAKGSFQKFYIPKKKDREEIVLPKRMPKTIGQMLGLQRRKTV